MSYLVLYSLTMLLATSKCRPYEERVDVFDSKNDIDMTNECTGINYHEYCKDIGVCTEGTHIMCMYYRTGQISGQACRNGRMIRLGSATKKLILEKFQTVRTEMTYGTIRGKNDVLLPKAKKGQAELKWDEELALFAQVWANQCEMLAEDKCRATNNFSNPGQMVAVVKTVFSKTEETNTSCIKREALKEAIDTFFDTWKQDVKHVTPEDIKHYKRKDKIDGESRRNHFLTLVNGRTTHIGCGLSAYENYEYTDKGYDQLFIELVCNLSSQLIEDEPVYKFKLEIENTSEESTKDTVTGTTDETNKGTTEETAKVTTDKSNGETTSNSSSEVAYLEGNGSDRRPTVLILPIITVEDAPRDQYMQKLSVINENLRGYSKEVLPSKSLLYNMNEQANQKPRTSKNGSIFTRVPRFHLPSQNHNSKRKKSLQENILLRNKLKALLKKVPRKDLSLLEKALKSLKRKRDRRVNPLSTISPLLNLNVYNEINLTNTEVPKIQSVNIRLTYNAPIKRTDGTDDDLLSVAKGVLKITDRGKEAPLIYVDKNIYRENEYRSRRNNSITNAEKDEKWTVNTVLGNVTDRNRSVDIQSQLDSIPTMRKQIPIVNAKENNVFGEKYSKFQKQGYSSLYRNDKSINNYINDTTVQEQTGRFVDASKIDSKSKRRIYLENEIYKLKRKLQHLRQYIRRNDISEKDRFRPVVDPHNRRQNIKLKDVENFYMPDRAHSLHEF